MIKLKKKLELTRFGYVKVSDLRNKILFNCGAHLWDGQCLSFMLRPTSVTQHEHFSTIMVKVCVCVGVGGWVGWWDNILHSF